MRISFWARVVLAFWALIGIVWLIAVATKTADLFGDVMAAWVQAVFAVAAIVASAGFFEAQRQADQKRDRDKARDIAQTAGEMAVYAMDLAAARLNASLESIKGKTLFELRGHQTTEMVQAMRELDLSQLDPKVVKHFAYIRAGIYAVNARITDVFETEKSRPSLKRRRRERLKSAGRVLKKTRGHLEDYHLALGADAVLPGCTVPGPLEPFLLEAEAETSSSSEAFD